MVLEKKQKNQKNPQIAQITQMLGRGKGDAVNRKPQMDRIIRFFAVNRMNEKNPL